MKRIIYVIILFTYCLNLNSQTIDDYELLNEILPNLLSIKKTDTINIYENSATFLDQEAVFTKEFFHSYTYPTLGVDSKKVKKLIKKLDFAYLSKQKKEVSKWEFSKFKYSIVKHKETTMENVSKVQYLRLFGISKPIYSKNRKMAFIYYEYFCGSLCGQTGLKIYIKKGGKWHFYEQIPLSIS